ncbi:DNA topoisomerase III [Exiguobacterium sp. RIT452]|uniref:DNA topoisomerase III n=1 Tax=Exiguobacterium sp. RIT452 TaxID=2315552 RepID=UPI000E7153BD|nr:DNA topoisomerase III [Exiguobacterium sp. RIT452]RJP02044.1 DNA topoisomerase III [Exiguobacterium sp. RIT452]
MQLIIAEKPKQAEKLAAPYPSVKRDGYIEIKPCDRFPAGAKLAYAVGHLCELQEPAHYDAKWKRWNYDHLPIIPERFDYRLSRGKSKAFQVIKKLLNERTTTSIIIASDAEREGEAIVRLILRLANNAKPLQRLWISSLTPQAVDHGFANLLDGKETENLFHEAMSRACADWLIGMNASRAYTTLLKKKGIADVFSLGRVQTPTLSLIVEREKQIENFRPETFFEVEADFTRYKGKYINAKKQTKITERELAEAIAARTKGTGIIATVEKTEQVEKPPFWFSLSLLQTEASRRFGLGAKETLDIAQKLYIRGWISYPRTDSSFVSKDEASQFPSILKRLLKQPEYAELTDVLTKNPATNKRYVNSAKVSDHYAIIPTEEAGAVAKLSGRDAQVYDLIVRRFLAAFAPDARSEKTEIVTQREQDRFITKGSRSLELGFKRVLQIEAKELDLPAVEIGQQVPIKSAKLLEKQTEPPKRYTEGTLILGMKTAGKVLENELQAIMKEIEGLGTEATRAGIIDGLKRREYIQVKKKEIHPTAKGRILIEAVSGSILASPEMTAKWESRLDQIGKGEASAAQFVEQAKKLSQHLVEDAKTRVEQLEVDPTQVPAKRARGATNRPVGICPVCQAELLDRGKFYGCSAYQKKNCGFTLPKTILGARLTQAELKKVLAHEKTKPLDMKKNGRTFRAMLYLEQNQLKFEFVKGEA